MPVASPDLRCDLDGVVMRNDDAPFAGVVQRERALASALAEVPHDAQALLQVRTVTVATGSVAAAERRLAAKL